MGVNNELLSRINTLKSRLQPIKEIFGFDSFHILAQCHLQKVSYMFHSLVEADDVAAWAPHLNLLLAQHLQTNLYQELVEQLLLRLDLAVSASPSLRPAV